MKKIIATGLILTIALTAAAISNGPALAEDNKTAPIFAALSSSVSSCGRVSEAGLCRSGSSAANANRTMAAVSCGANQWCCKHEDFSKGTCAKCCPK